ncbi:hypothetical protein B0H13DRAFT_1867525 [Mycena leptocephala]|nr:hypothetical protein B0H13DRAFT_1867525 [Mycena leptocephala]
MSATPVLQWCPSSFHFDGGIEPYNNSFTHNPRIQSFIAVIIQQILLASQPVVSPAVISIFLLFCFTRLHLHPTSRLLPVYTAQIEPRRQLLPYSGLSLTNLPAYAAYLVLASLSLTSAPRLRAGRYLRTHPSIPARLLLLPYDSRRLALRVAAHRPLPTRYIRSILPSIPPIHRCLSLAPPSGSRLPALPSADFGAVLSDHLWLCPTKHYTHQSCRPVPTTGITVKILTRSPWPTTKLARIAALFSSDEHATEYYLKFPAPYGHQFRRSIRGSIPHNIICDLCPRPVLYLPLFTTALAVLPYRFMLGSAWYLPHPQPAARNSLAPRGLLPQAEPPPRCSTIKLRSRPPFEPSELYKTTDTPTARLGAELKKNKNTEWRGNGCTRELVCSNDEDCSRWMRGTTGDTRNDEGHESESENE